MWGVGPGLQGKRYFVNWCITLPLGPFVQGGGHNTPDFACE